MCVVYYWSAASMFSSHQGCEVRIEGEKKQADATTTVVNGSGVLCDGGRKDDAKIGP
jgi:hypothetical protein